MTADFYSYVIFDWRGRPCYVGKGRGNRLAKTLSGALPHNPTLGNTIIKTKRVLGDVPLIKVRDGLTENEAFETEIALIAAIGRKPNGPLLNLTGGGDGASDPDHETRIRRSLGAKAAHARPDVKERHSQALRDAFARPLIRKKAIEQLKEAGSDPVIVAKRDRAVRDAIARDPAFLQKRGKAWQAAFLALSPQERELRRQIIRDTVNRPELLAARLQRLAEMNADPERKAERIRNLKRSHERTRAERCARLAAMRSDPEIQDRRREAIRQAWMRRRGLR